MIRRLEVQSDLLFTKLPALNIPLPKLETKNASHKTKIYVLPSDDEIERCLERANVRDIRSAIDDASSFGIHVDPSDIQTTSIPVSKLNSDIDTENYNSDDEDELEKDDLQNQDDNDQDVSFHREVEEILKANEESTKETSYVTMVDHTGVMKSVRKSTVVWLMSEGGRKISSDRLKRVQETTQALNQSLPDAAPLDTESKIKCMVQRKNHIKIGEWCFFKYEGMKNSRPVDTDIICLGLILAFKYVNGKSEREKSYKGEVVYLDDESIENTEALASWYQINDTARFVPVETENHRFLKIKYTLHLL